MKDFEHAFARFAVELKESGKGYKNTANWEEEEEDEREGSDEGKTDSVPRQRQQQRVLPRPAIGKKKGPSSSTASCK